MNPNPGENAEDYHNRLMKQVDTLLREGATPKQILNDVGIRKKMKQFLVELEVVMAAPAAGEVQGFINSIFPAKQIQDLVITEIVDDDSS